MTGIKTQHIEFGAYTFGCTEISEPSGNRDVFCTTDIKSELINGLTSAA
ncbi:unannotated protein [freshwater metagenome]|uniref:Unannotated protein n=1 Tax=freshwater metagenome TaxID=449393 RepID=A0A6J7IHB0_9ZZZZ